MEVTGKTACRIRARARLKAGSNRFFSLTNVYVAYIIYFALTKRWDVAKR